MKRFGAIIAGGLLTLTMVGCDGGGLDEKPTGEVNAASSQTDRFKEEMKKNAGKMGITKKQERPKIAPASKAEKSAPAEETKP